MNDAEIVEHIDRLVAEEHTSSATTASGSCPKQERRAPATRSRSSSTSAGTCCASAGPGATPARIPAEAQVRRPTWWSTTSSERRHPRSRPPGPSPCTDKQAADERRVLESSRPAPDRRAVAPGGAGGRTLPSRIPPPARPSSRWPTGTPPTPWRRWTPPTGPSRRGPPPRPGSGVRSCAGRSRPSPPTPATWPC